MDKIRNQYYGFFGPPGVGKTSLQTQLQTL